ncbi:MAG: GxxExxY protein [Saprospiraceae bacterium]
MQENEITGAIVDASLKVHRALGPGLLESVYEEVLAYELANRGFEVHRQVAIPVVYEDVVFDKGFRADIIVNGKVIIELKSVEELKPVHYKQLLTYLKLGDKRVGLLINFNVNLIKHGIKRIVNNL